MSSARRMDTSVPALRAADVSVELGHKAILSGVTVEVQHGEVLALVGPNGAGKSTLLSVLTGDRAAGQGRVQVDGEDLAHWHHGDLARRRAVLTQENQVSFPFTVRDVVAMGRAPWQGRPEADGDDVAVEAALAATDVAHLSERSFPSLSGGEKARVSLARVLAQQTDIVLLDEPTAALDLRHQEDVMGIARERASAGCAVVVVLHDLSIAAAYADSIAILDRGVLAAFGDPSDVMTAELLERVYGIAVRVLDDPDGGSPVIVPVRR
ncbi:heme ABC transporter ATP-binding protein [Demequina oxidasica]|uniref:heme ABC transporter ATP-binding protein n=1 Tax=Demequina oxidasica TaxID=676199 RepID=UPI000A059791|nr:heme ABC transporter ATP-binding protein [Demequina oxidasica]